jgi:FAD/FMN-containing dehydrogenase
MVLTATEGPMTLTQPTADLAAAIAGEIVLPEHDHYDATRAIFNAMVDRRPALIVRPRSTADVALAIRYARAAGLQVAVRGGGHSVAGHAVADDALVIDLSLMRGVEVDPDRPLAHAEGGALWEDVDRATTAHGLATPGGTFVDTGIGGLTLGGGIGLLMPLAGFTCDNLVEAEVVTADGSVVLAGGDGDPDLLWALRGGGGNFGVVTRFTYRLTPIAPMMFGGRIKYPASAARQVYERVGELVERHPTAFLPTLTLARDPELGPLVGVVMGVVDGTDPDLVAGGLRRDLPLAVDDLRPMTYLELQADSGIIPFGLRHYWKGHFLRELDVELFAALAEGLDTPASMTAAFVLFEGITAAGRVEPDGGAAFGQRGATWNASAIAMWESVDDDAAGIGWARSVVELLEPHSFSGAGYVNYSPPDESETRVRAVFGDDRWARLVAVKRRYDPDNLFRFNHNISPVAI